MSQLRPSLLALLAFSLALPVCAGCVSAWKKSDAMLAGESLGGDESLLLKPGESPEDLNEWDKFTRKTKYQTQKLFNMEPNEPIAREHFAKGEKLFLAKEYAKAAEEFESAAKRWPDSPLEEDAMYMQGESLFFCDKYMAASDAYGEMMKKYTNSRYLERAVGRQFAIARFWEDKNRVEPHYAVTPNFTDKTRPWFDTEGNAIKAYESVHLNDPTGPLADDAVMATANAHFLSERYEDADYYYDLLRKQYPQSEHQQVAFLLGLRAKMRSYQGPHYEGSPLEESEELVQQISSQFELPPDEKERQRNASREIRNQFAQREWETAEYYAKTKHYGAARYHYGVLISDHGDTPYAEAAKRRLEEQKGLPDNPPDRFKWITRIFNPKQDD